ncbi:MAG: butyrate kinase [Oscillospiraceae bacterium]|nr:butyrate kinase [Oscillospiraceae bacterium]
MAEYTILTVNPGSTSTKVGLVKGEEILLDLNVDTDPAEFAACKTFGEQAPAREQKIMDMLSEAGVDMSQIDAVSGRGVGVHSCEGGTYLIDDLVYDHAFNDVIGINHVATLGIILAKRIADKLGKPAYFVNPVSTDELCDEARMTGVKGLYRPSRAHPLNMKQVAIQHSKLQGKRYEECNYVIMHMGGGISVGAHRKGKAIDQTRIGDGQGPISPNRAGDICTADVLTLLKRGLSLDEVKGLCSRKGGLIDLCGTDDVRKIRGELIPAGDKRAAMALDAMEYTLVKWASMMAGALKGKVDAILMTGGLAHDKVLVEQLKADLEWIAPVYVYPGSFETEALASGAMRVLSGEEEVKRYSGKPVWDGFDFDKE